MSNPLTAEPEALHLFFTDDIYLVPEQVPAAAAVPETPLPEAVELPQPTFNYLGGNKRNILILVYDEQHQVSDEAGRELLRKIVKSINLATPDFALLNYAGYKTASFAQLAAFFSPKLVFSFGVSPRMLGLSAAHAQDSLVKEGATSCIFSSELRALDQDPAAKKTLWSCLKNLQL
jgi:hypothetical protein